MQVDLPEVSERVARAESGRRWPSKKCAWKTQREAVVTSPSEPVPPLVCWIVVSSVPYHDARLKAAAEAGKLRVCMVQLTEMENFAVLQQERESSAFPRYTLFPETPLNQIKGRAMIRRLHACLSEIQPAVVCINGWSYGGGAAALQWCLPRAVPVVLMSESTAIDAKRHWWMEALKRRVVGLCSAALVGGAPHREYMKALGARADAVFTGYNAVDNEHFRAGAEAARREERLLRSKLGLPNRYFLACARFVPKKNLCGLLRAYARYRQWTGPEAWSLVIIGDGELKRQLFALRDQLGLRDKVLFPGPKKYEALPAYYGLAGAFIHGSTTEQWGLVVNEAMAAGLPVVVSNRCGCAADLVQEGRNGFSFDPNDALGFATALCQTAEDSSRRQQMGRASQDIIASWSPRRFADGLAGAVEAALASNTRRPGMFDRVLLHLLSTR
jgi:1,2-diacylglycerol 3-alpha-glucosyltransferase